MTRRRNESAAVDASAPSASTLPEFSWEQRLHLRRWRHNAHSGDVDGAAASIKRFGWGRPLVVNRFKGLEGEIIAGHTALAAAELLERDADYMAKMRAEGHEGMVPVRWVSLPAKLAHALSRADNKLAEKSEWDTKVEAEFIALNELEPDDWIAAGFEESDIKGLLFGAWPRKGKKQKAGKGAKELKYSVIVECKDEDQQTAIIERLELDGHTCKPWVG